MGKKESEQGKYERWLSTTTAEERRKLLKEGIGMEVPGERIERKPQTEAEMQAIRLERLMERFDVPLDEPEDRGDMYQAPFRKRHLQGEKVEKDEFHSVYRLSRKKEVAKEKMLEMEAAEALKREIYQEERERIRQKEEEASAKKRAKRNRRKSQVSKKIAK